MNLDLDTTILHLPATKPCVLTIRMIERCRPISPERGQWARDLLELMLQPNR